MTMDNHVTDVSNDVKANLLTQEIAMLRVTQYQFEVRARAARAVKNERMEKEAMAELENIIKTIDFYGEELKTLNVPAPTTKRKGTSYGQRV